MAQTDRDTCFHGSISWGQDENGIPGIPDRIDVNNGFVCAQAGHQDELLRKLDTLAFNSSDYCLHDDAGKNNHI